ncbi:MAG: peptidylprolyl isomerase [Candidatus Omnitrophota bacterium]|nr:peptidylprolyl isomerase [Candidatus Omnitrophota bacterium]
MRLHRYIILLMILPLAFLTGCGRGSSPNDKTLVTVADKSITVKDFKNKFSKLPRHYQAVAEKNKKNLLDDMIVESLFLEDAIRKGIDKDKEIQDILVEARKKIIIAKFVKTEVDDKVKVSGDEMKAFYEEHKDGFKTPGMWRASHILLASEGEAKDVLAELSKGVNFEDIARARSIDATSSRGGDVGYFRQGQVVPEFESACLGLNAGQTSSIVRTQFGYHIIKLTDKKSEELEPYESAKPKIENELKLKKRNELFDKLVVSLKEKYRVRVEPGAIKALEAK